MDLTLGLPQQPSDLVVLLQLLHAQGLLQLLSGGGPRLHAEHDEAPQRVERKLLAACAFRVRLRVRVRVWGVTGSRLRLRLRLRLG